MATQEWMASHSLGFLFIVVGSVILMWFLIHLAIFTLVVGWHGLPVNVLGAWLTWFITSYLSVECQAR